MNRPRWLGSPSRGRMADELPDRLLTAEELASRLRVSRRYVYEHAAEFPFLVRLPGRTVRFSERGYERWVDRAA